MSVDGWSKVEGRVNMWSKFIPRARTMVEAPVGITKRRVTRKSDGDLIEDLSL